MSLRHALVTGANRGIGLGFARQLLVDGWHVVATCRQPGRATDLNMLAGEHPGRLHVLPLDVAEPKSHAELVRELPLVLDGRDDDRPGRIDLLVNNAGVLHSGERFGSLSAANFEDSLRINAIGPLLFTQSLAPSLSEGARILNLSSRLGSITLTTRFGTPSYDISKAALNMATVLLARALEERGIVVVAISPGWVRTDMGGSDGEVAVDDAVAGMLQVASRLQPVDNGRFLDWQGKLVPW
ncbi:MAG: SDR family oxidoreductase [Luteimonas sp.]|nr:SDR family oxidoreductase [Luteimonas sp.]